jgi:formylglycine-generating enzyme required for sulfatase activity
MADELERFQSGRPTLTTPLGIHLRAARFLKRHQWSLALAVGLAVLIIAGLWAWQRTNEWMLTRCRVRIVTDPPGCQIAIVPLDDLTGVPLVDQCLRPPIANDYPLTIKPGWYLIEAYHPELGVQEVFRFVSRELADYQAVKNEPNLKHIPSCRSAAEIEANGRVMLPPIRLLSGKEQAKPNTMSLVDGGEFRTGSDVVTIFPQELVNVPAFWMDTQEVSIGEYEAVMGSLPLQLRLDPEAARADRDSPVRQVQYFEALEYAERTGKRLPTLDEYLFATTNGGTTKFPWGDDLIEHDWDITASQPPSFDFNRGMPPVGGLFSRVVEWTQSSPTQPLPTFAQAVGGLPSNSSPPIGGAMRVLVGGGPSVSIGKPSAIEAEMGPRFLNLFSTYEAPALGIGFRCVRSVKPRFVLLK